VKFPFGKFKGKEMIEEEKIPPNLFCSKDGRTDSCPYCGDPHYHGVKNGYGHRLSHCVDRVTNPGYYLVPYPPNGKNGTAKVMDTVGWFLAENIIVSLGNEFKIPKNLLWNSFQAWCIDGNHIQKFNKITFGKELVRRHNFKSGGNGNMFWTNTAYCQNSQYR